MTLPKRPNDLIGTIGKSLTIIAAFIGACWFLAPLRTMSDDMLKLNSGINEVKMSMVSIQTTQATQAETIRIMANAVVKIQELRTDFEKHSSGDSEKNIAIKASVDDLKNRVADLERTVYKRP